MEFVSNIEDMLAVVGPVESRPNRRGIEKGIQMALPEDQMPNGKNDISIYRIVYGENSSGKRYIETVSIKDGVWPIYGEASIPEILVFAEKAKHDMPESNYTKELCALAHRIKVALG